MIKNLQPKENGNKGISQTVMLGRHISHEIKDLYVSEIQKNPDIKCHWKDDERIYKGIHKNHLPLRRDQPKNEGIAGKQLIENQPGVTHQDELSLLQTEGEIHESNEVKMSLSSSSSVSPCQRISPAIQTNNSKKYGNDVMHSSIETQEHTAHGKTLQMPRLWPNL